LNWRKLVIAGVPPTAIESAFRSLVSGPAVGRFVMQGDSIEFGLRSATTAPEQGLLIMATVKEPYHGDESLGILTNGASLACFSFEKRFPSAQSYLGLLTRIARCPINSVTWDRAAGRDRSQLCGDVSRRGAAPAPGRMDCHRSPTAGLPLPARSDRRLLQG